MTQRNPDPQKEILSRARRIETRLTTLMIRLGLDGEGQKPTFIAAGLVPGTNELGAVIQLPSIDCALSSILACVPTGWAGDVRLMVGNDHVTTLAVWDRT